MQALLTSPEPDSPQDAVVAAQFKANPREFQARARAWRDEYALGALQLLVGSACLICVPRRVRTARSTSEYDPTAHRHGILRAAEQERPCSQQVECGGGDSQPACVSVVQVASDAPAARHAAAITAHSQAPSRIPRRRQSHGA
jgi:hypothetical protein